MKVRIYAKLDGDPLTFATAFIGRRLQKRFKTRDICRSLFEVLVIDFGLNSCKARDIVQKALGVVA